MLKKRLYLTFIRLWLMLIRVYQRKSTEEKDHINNKQDFDQRNNINTMNVRFAVGLL